MKSVRHRVLTGRVVQDPRDGRTPAGRLRAAIEAYAGGGRGRKRALLDSMGIACLALGVTIPVRAAVDDFQAAMLDNPWGPAEAPAAARIQVIRLSGEPGPASMAFGDGVIESDLHDLGGEGRWYRPVPRRAAVQALDALGAPSVNAANFRVTRAKQEILDLFARDDAEGFR